MKIICAVLYVVLWASVSIAGGKTEEYRTVTLESIACSIQVPKDWSVHDESNRDSISWIITPDDLNIGPYQTGVRIDLLLDVKHKTGSIASNWVSDRILNKSTSLEVLSSEEDLSKDYFKVKRLVIREVYSEGRTDYTTYRMIYSWFWNDTHDVVICMVARAPEKSWESMVTILKKIGKVEFNEDEWKKRVQKDSKEMR